MIRSHFAAATLLALTALVAAAAPKASPPPDPLLEGAVAAAQGGTLAAYAATVEKAASEALVDPASAELPRLVQLATLREFARWFGRVTTATPEQREALAWLIRQRRLAPTLILSATSADPPDRVLAILTALHKEQRSRLEQLPELTAAVCLVWDDADRFGGDDRPIDLPRILRVFRHYADHPGLTRDAASELPVELLVFVVDNMLSEGEIEWARRQYGAGPPDVGEAYFDVAYGPTRDLKREPKPDEDPANVYNLANLRKFGGRLADQAYLASQVGKTFGIPTATCTALQGEAREAQQWVAFIDPRADDTRWNTTAGRYRIHASSVGEVLDPQTMETFPQGELSLVAEATRASASKRAAAAAALCKLLDGVPQDQQLAALRRAIELSPADRRVWRRLADWTQDKRLESSEFRDAVALVAAQLMPRSDEAALHVRLRMLAKVAAADDRIAALAELRQPFQHRPDLVAIIQLARARAMIERKDLDGALRAVAELLASPGAIPLQAVESMRVVDDVLRERSELDRLASIYAQVWKGMRPPVQSPCPHTTPYFVIGQEYAQLLEELERTQELQGVRERLAELWAEPVRR